MCVWDDLVLALGKKMFVCWIVLLAFHAQVYSKSKFFSASSWPCFNCLPQFMFWIMVVFDKSGIFLIFTFFKKVFCKRCLSKHDKSMSCVSSTFFSLKESLPSCCMWCSCQQINLIAPPQYVVTTQTMERSEGVEMLNKTLEAIKAEILASGGHFDILQQVIPHVLPLPFFSPFPHSFICFWTFCVLIAISPTSTYLSLLTNTMDTIGTGSPVNSTMTIGRLGVTNTV